MGDESEVRNWLDNDDFMERQGPDDPGDTQGGDGAGGPGGWDAVMGELRDKVSETSGRWTATQAALFDQRLDPDDSAAAAFFEETGLGPASDAGIAASNALQDALNAGGSYSAEQYAAMVQTGADAQHAVLDADGTRNRYQQTTDFGDADMLAQMHDSLDDQTAAMLADAAADPSAHFIGMTPEEIEASAQAQWDAATAEASAAAGDGGG